MAINLAPTSPLNNPVTFFTGTDDYMYIRRFAKWLDIDYIAVRRQDYETINEMKDVFDEPWEQKIYLDGTDGNQFHTDIKKEEILSAWVNDLGRNGYFTYMNSDTDTYNGLEMMNFQIADYMMKDLVENPDNAKFNAYISGTSNMSTIL